MSETALARADNAVAQRNGTAGSAPLRVNAEIGLIELGNALAKSGYFKDATDASKAIVKVLYGQELGVGPIAAMMGIHIIEGKPAPSANLLAAMVRRSGIYGYRVVEHTDQACELLALERGQEVGRQRWTIQDATRAGLAGKNTWKSYPRQMLFSRCISELVRTYFPDLFGGAPVYTPEELGAEVNPDTGEPLRAAPEYRVDTRTGEVINAAETGESFVAQSVSGTDLNSLKRQYAERYIATTGRALGDTDAKALFRDYTGRALGREVELKALTADDLHELLREFDALEGRRKCGFALYSQAGGDPNNGDTMRREMAAALGLAGLESRRDVTPREWSEWNAILEAQVGSEPASPADADPFEKEA